MPKPTDISVAVNLHEDIIVAAKHGYGVDVSVDADTPVEIKVTASDCDIIVVTEPQEEVIIIAQPDFEIDVPLEIDTPVAINATEWPPIVEILNRKINEILELGLQVYFQITETHLQYKIEDGEWQNLAPISDLKGDKGNKGDIGEAGNDGNNGTDGQEVSIQKTTTHIQWRLGLGEWQNLIPLADLKGDIGEAGNDGTDGSDGSDGTDGQEISIQKTTTHIQWRLGLGEWQNLIPLADLKGDIGEAGNDGTDGSDGSDGSDGADGQEVSIQKTTTHIQWRLGLGEWQNLIPLADLKGDIGEAGTDGNNGTDGSDGADGQEVSIQKTTTHIQWRLGLGEWQNLIPLADLKGDKGDDVWQLTDNKLTPVSEGVKVPASVIEGLLEGSGNLSQVTFWGDNNVLTGDDDIKWNNTHKILLLSKNTRNNLPNLRVGDISTIGSYIQVLGSSDDTETLVFEGKKRYPRLRLTDTTPGGTSFNLWNLGATLRFGTDTSNAGKSAWYTKSGQAADVVFNGNLEINKSIKMGRTEVIDIDRNASLKAVNGESLRIEASKTPASLTAPGNKGDICWDENYIYVCINNNVWRRAPYEAGVEVQFQTTATHIQWRQGAGEWQNLIPLADLKGDIGEAGNDGNDGNDGNNGSDGQEISIQKTTTHIQWRLGLGEWQNLVPLADLKGDIGETGADAPALNITEPSVIAVGGIPAGTTFNNITFPEFVSMQLYPKLFPTLTAPSQTFTASISGLKEIGEVLAGITFISALNRGKINPQYQSDSPFRSGEATEYLFDHINVTAAKRLVNTPSAAVSNTQAISSYTVVVGVQSWRGRIAYAQGAQPKGSKGSNFDSPLGASTSSYITRSINGVYPCFGTTHGAGISTQTKLALAAHGSMLVTDMAAESATHKQTAMFPTAWGTLSKLEQYNELSGQWDTILSGSFTQSLEPNFNYGNGTTNYNKYTHNGGAIGRRMLRWSFT